MPDLPLQPVCDGHIHSFEKGRKHEGTAYIPPEMDLDDYLPEAQANRVKRAVIIQASVDGTDNSGLARTLRAAPKGLELRGVAMISTGATGLEDLAQAGVRALRIQDRGRLGLNNLALLPYMSRRAAEMDWHIELNTEPERFDQLASGLAAMPTDQQLVLDHIAHIDPSRPEDLTSLLRLLDSGQVWVKLCPTRVSQRPADFRDLATIVSTLATRFPERCIWGSDWPHVMTAPPLPRISAMLQLLQDVMEEAALRACLWENPARLYGF